MCTLSKKDQQLLGSLRVCPVHETKHPDFPEHIPRSGQRVFVPLRLMECFHTLKEQGGNVVELNPGHTIEQIARTKIGAIYQATSLPEHAPRYYSCSTFTFWVFSCIGMRLPRYAIDQSYIGQLLTRPSRPGLAFYQNRFPIRDSDRAIGHVGITTREGTIIHGSVQAGRILEEPIPEHAVLFTDPFPLEPHMLLIIPKKIKGIETALDLARWLARPLRT